MSWEELKQKIEQMTPEQMKRKVKFLDTYGDGYVYSGLQLYHCPDADETSWDEIKTDDHYLALK